MRIAFDGTTLRPGRTGVGYYSEHLLHHLVESGDHEVVVVSNRPIDTTRPLPAGARVATSSWRAPRVVWMQALAPRLLRRLDPDVVSEVRTVSIRSRPALGLDVVLDFEVLGRVRKP